MKRVHISVNVDNLEEAVTYYGALFGANPDVLKEDYARFRLDEPCMNFSMTSRGRTVGVDHMGIDVDSGEELVEVTERLLAAGHATSDLTEGACCYALSTKSWSVDPAGVPWETFHTTGTAAVYGTDKIDDSSIASSARTDGRAISSAARDNCC